MNLMLRAARRLFVDRQLDTLVSLWGSTLSLGQNRACVVRVIDEAPDTKTFVLRCRMWRGHRPGQYVTIAVEIDGVTHRRCYSVSSAPATDMLSFTVRRIEGGLVSGFLHAHVRAGRILTLGSPEGVFVLPASSTDGLLFLAAGSGITPIMSMLRARASLDGIVLVSWSRSREHAIFGAELRRMANHGLRLVERFDDEGGRFDERSLPTVVPDFAERETFLCGPPGLMSRIEQLYGYMGASSRLTVERFVTAAPIDDGADVTLKLLSGRTITADRSSSLLAQLERAGERPTSGCRAGICHACTCMKRSGTVLDLLTGELSSATDEQIRLCVSVPRSDLELDLRVAS
ncbi:MAG: ferredoxin reductase [Polyangia bacterium]